MTTKSPVTKTTEIKTPKQAGAAAAKTAKAAAKSPSKGTAAKTAAAKKPVEKSADRKADPGPAPGQIKSAAPTPASKSAANDAAAALQKSAKPKHKLVRDSFTMPRADFDLIDALKERALDFRHPVKKSELLRAGLHALAALDDVQLRSRLEKLAPLKPGRPKKSD